MWKSFRSRSFVTFASAVLALVAGLGAAHALTQPAPVHVIPEDIAHGSSCDRSLPDVTAALQQWITSLPNHSVARLGPNQCYHTEYPLTIGAKTGVIFDGNGSTLAAVTDS